MRETIRARSGVHGNAPNCMINLFKSGCFKLEVIILAGH